MNFYTKIWLSVITLVFVIMYFVHHPVDVEFYSHCWDLGGNVVSRTVENGQILNCYDDRNNSIVPILEHFNKR